MDNKLSSCEILVFAISLLLIGLIITGVVIYVNHQGGYHPVAPGEMWYNGGTRDLV